MTIDFYTNVHLSRNNILVCGYRDGERYRQTIPFRPTMYLPAQPNEPHEYKTLDDKPVKELNFDSIREAKDFIKEYSDIENFSIYGLDKFIYQYIYKNFPGHINYDASLIKVWNIDIETDSSSGFPDVETANKAITLIGVGIGKLRIVFGWGEYKPKKDYHLYIRCVDEKEMLIRFLNMCQDEEKRPDVLTGWNIETFDVPYLINRMKRELHPDEYKRISPWGIIQDRTIESRGKELKIYSIAGVSILDYLVLYKKFTYNQQESYTLDHIAFVETGKRKLDYTEYDSLHDLYEKNYEMFVDYNITDIDRVADIDEKNKFIELVFAIAYDAKVNFVDALTSVLLWDIICHNYLLDKKIVTPPYKHKEFIDIPGGYVKDPHIGMHDWIVSFDLQSLYPHLIMQYNISPETIVDIDPWDDDKIKRMVNREFDFSTEKYIQAGNGARFRKDKRGFLAELMKQQFNLRVEYKDKMIAAKKEFEINPSQKLTNEIARYNNAQMAKKIQLNSLYGALANQGCRYYDWRLASAITLSGQLSVRWTEARLNEHFNKLLNTENVDYIVAIDTDSCYINFNNLVKKLGLSNKKAIVDFLDKISKDKIQPILKKSFDELANRMNAYENAMFMKREAIADKALWQAKKRYIMNVWDNEGVRYAEPHIKIQGLEAVKSSTPQVCRDAIIECYKIVMNKNEDDLIRYVEIFRRNYEHLSFEEIASPRGVNGIEKYSDSATVFKLGTPFHVRGALTYNDMLKRRKLDNKYPLIQDKDKVKFCYLKVPNPSRCYIIAAPRILPAQLGLDEFLDRDLQFEKTFLLPLKLILASINWNWEKKETLDEFFQ